MIIRKATEVLQPVLSDIQRRFERVNEGLADKKTSSEAMAMLSSSGFRVRINALSAPIFTMIEKHK